MQTEKKSSHCVFACICMADYSMLYERMLLVILKNVETTINMSQSCVKLYACTKFGTNIVGEMCANSVT